MVLHRLLSCSECQKVFEGTTEKVERPVCLECLEGAQDARDAKDRINKMLDEVLG